MTMPTNMPLSRNERLYLISRLRADEITQIDSQVADEWGLPVVIADREIFDLYGKLDARAARMLEDSRRPIMVPNPPDGWKRPTQHAEAPLPSWAVTGRARWSLIGIGAGMGIAFSGIVTAIIGVFL